LCTVDLCWPDFREEELDVVLAEYGTRERRFGGLVRK
jgi:undecaprenyl pyrophosphate synthase